MKLHSGWYWPDHEKHLIQWLESTPPIVLNGRKAYQGKKQALAYKSCRSFHTAIDVGAHVGLWSYNMAGLFRTVHAFEPVAEHRECFKMNVRLDSEHLHLHDVALGADYGSVNVEATPGSSGDSWVRGEGLTKMVPLDAFNITNVDFLKVDCEGYEENVLRGARGTIERWKPTIIVEQKRDMAQRFGLEPLGAVAFLKSLGYTVLAEMSGDYLMQVPK